MFPVDFTRRKQINYVKFSLIPLSAHQQKRLINKYTIKIMNDPQKQWMITYRRYTNNRWDYLFRYIIQTDVKQLWLSFNLQTSILRDITNVRFPYLMKLYVWENHINSLEPLEFLHAPNLREINMGNLYEKNQITNLKPLRKILSKNLNQINISHNPVRDLSPLKFIMFQPQLKGIFTQNRQDQLIINDLTVFIKTKNTKFTGLIVQSMHRIRQFKVEAMLQRKYPQMKLKVRELGLNYYQNHMIKKVIDTPRLEAQTISFKSGGEITF